MIALKDLLLTESGDLLISENGDISTTDSISQAIGIRLRWFLEEWKFNQEFGVPYYEEILIKNASKLHAEQIMREQIMSVDEVQDVPDIEVEINSNTRKMKVKFTAEVDGQILRKEMRFDV